VQHGRRLKATATVGAGILTIGVAVTGIAVARTRGEPAHHSRTVSAARTLPTTARSAPTTPVPVVTRPQSSPATSANLVPAPTTPPTTPPVHVPALRRLTPPDAVVTLPRAASRLGMDRLRHTTGVTLVTALDRGTVTLTTAAAHGHRRQAHRLSVVGVPLSDIRGFTPKLTATSTKLWRSVARGEITVSYDSGHSQHLAKSLGATLPATSDGATAGSLRLGALASIGLPGADALVSRQRAHSLRLRPAREVLVAAPQISLDALTAAVHSSLGSGAHVSITRPEPVDQNVSSSYALAAIPMSYLDLYRRAATTCPGLPWTVLAGIGTVETGNGNNIARSTKGAEGPMQFLPSTWAMYGVDADGDGKADIMDPVDAVFSAARYLCAAGASRGGQSLNDSIFSYNHAWWYVREVVDLANRYA
jgi:hypothetical protein